MKKCLPRDVIQLIVFYVFQINVKFKYNFNNIVIY